MPRRNGAELDGRNDVDRAGEMAGELQCRLELADRGNQNATQAWDGEGNELVLTEHESWEGFCMIGNDHTYEIGPWGVGSGGGTDSLGWWISGWPREPNPVRETGEKKNNQFLRNIFEIIIFIQPSRWHVCESVACRILARNQEDVT